MIADGLWRAKARRAMRVHQSRPRRDCVGDLVQIDGSPHAWFEDRGPECVLIVYVDDATTRLLATGFFCRNVMETTDTAAARYSGPLQQQEGQGGPADAVLAGVADAGYRGDPRAQPAGEGARRAGQQNAAGPAGDVLRHGGGQCLSAGVHGGLQPALRGGAAEPGGHRAVLHDARELDLILCEQHTRKLTKNLTIRFERREYQVTGRGKGYRLRGAEVTVCKGFAAR